MKTHISVAVKLTVERKRVGGGGTKKTGSICFSSAPNTHKIYSAFTHLVAYL